MLKSMLVFSAPFIMRGMRRGGWLLVVLLLLCVCVRACVRVCACVLVTILLTVCMLTVWIAFLPSVWPTGSASSSCFTCVASLWCVRVCVCVCVQDQYEVVCNHTDQGIEFIKRVSNFVKDRIHAEQQYARELRLVMGREGRGGEGRERGGEGRGGEETERVERGKERRGGRRVGKREREFWGLDKVTRCEM